MEANGEAAILAYGTSNFFGLRMPCRTVAFEITPRAGGASAGTSGAIPPHYACADSHLGGFALDSVECQFSQGRETVIAADVRMILVELHVQQAVFGIVRDVMASTSSALEGSSKRKWNGLRSSWRGI